MFKQFQSVCVLSVVLLLSACAGVSQQAYNPAGAVPLKKVLVATQMQPPKVSVGIGGNIGLMFGGIGAVAAAASADSQQQTLDQMISGQGLNYHQRLQDAIVASFKAAGIQAELVQVNRAHPLDFVDDYKSLLAKHDADAILDVVVLEASYGGTHPILDREPRPILKLRAKLVSTHTLQQLYGEAISFGYSNPLQSAKEIKAPKQYYFQNMEAIAADKKRAAEGLGVAADEVAHFITGQLVSPGAATAKGGM